jgi:membrane-anchored glycerophosphoryl diester phosphodiesterase (GDPDase)
MLPRLAGLCLILFIPVVAVLGGLVALVVVAFESGSDALGAVGVMAIVGVCVVLGFVAIRLAVSTPALVLENLGVFAALARSWRLTAGRFWRTLGVLLVASLLIGVVQQVLGFAFQLVGVLFGFLVVATMGDDTSGALFGIVTFGVTIVGGLLAGLITQPFLAAVGALLYTDARIRKEGFDLALVRAVTTAPVGP